MNPFKNSLIYLGIYRKYIGRRLYLVFALATFTALAELLGISLLLPLLQNLEGGGVPENRVGKIIYEALKWIGVESSFVGILVVIGTIFFLKGLMNFLQLAYRGYLQAKLMQELKEQMFDSFSVMNYRYYIKRDTGYFINLINEQTVRFFSSFNGYTNYVMQLVMTIAYLALAFLIDWQFALLVLVVGIILMIVFRYLNSFVRQSSLKMASEMGHLNKLLVQTLQSFKYIVSTHKIGHLQGGVLQSIRRLTSYHIQQQVAMAFTQAVREPMAIFFIIGVMAIQVLVLNSPLAPIFVAVLLFYRGISSTFDIQKNWQHTMNLIGSVEMVDKEFDILTTHKEVSGTVKLDRLQQSIELCDVSFVYSDNRGSVLNNVSLQIPVNQTVAILGESGAGKTTLVDLLTLILKPSSGIITIDGVLGPDVELSSWRKQIGYVSQETVVFDDTIANNISLCLNEQSIDEQSIDEQSIDEQIKDAAHKAKFAEFVDTLENGYDTVVGDRGIRLSGGQRQRLFIARELFKQPNLLLLDEATSSLDTESERYIQASVDELKGKMTVVIIAHRLSTIRNVDYIYVLDKGKIIEHGTYLELRDNKKSHFRKMVEMQLL